MNTTCTKTLFVYLDAESLPKLEGETKSVVAHDEDDVRQQLKNNADFSNVFVLRVVRSIDGVYIRSQFNQRTGHEIFDLMFKHLMESGFEVGAYKLDDDSSSYRFIRAEVYGQSKGNAKIYEIVAPSMESLKLCYDFIRKHLGELK